MPSRSSHHRRALIACAALATCISTALAADPAPLQPGAHIRVTMVPRPEPAPPAHAERAFLSQPLPMTITGELVAFTDTDITLATSTHGPPETVPLDEVDTLELRVQRGRRTQGALIGLGAGALTGMVIGLASGDDPEGDNPWDWEATAGEKAVLAALVLAPVGAVVGALVAPGERWEAVSERPFDLGVTVGQPGGNGVYVAVRF